VVVSRGLLFLISLKSESFRQISPEVPRESLEKIAELLVEIEKRIAELSVQTGGRIEEIEREETRSQKPG